MLSCKLLFQLAASESVGLRSIKLLWKYDRAGLSASGITFRHVPMNQPRARDGQFIHLQSLHSLANPPVRLNLGRLALPYYLRTVPYVWHGSSLPQIDKVLLPQAGHGLRSCLWDIALPARQAVVQLLETVGGLLQSRAMEVDYQWLHAEQRWATLPGIEAFRMPLGGAHGNAGCMLLDMNKVSEAPYFTVSSGYTWMQLAVDMVQPRNSRIIREGVHRFILWAMYGPPGQELINPVLMHTCGDRRCISPLHMVWGEQRENIDRANAVQLAINRVNARTM